MRKVTCPDCSRTVGVYLTPADRARIRDFKSEYPWVRNDSIATLLQISTSRCSEIISGNITKEKKDGTSSG